jgi:putative two-component system response regulator
MSNKDKEILIVDDKIDNIKLLNSFLEKEGYKLRNALDGETAILSVNVKAPDIILLDINMPKMNGFEVCKILKSNPKTSYIPIIFISALNDLDSKIEAFNLGGIDYIIKPFASEEVIARVKTHLELSDYQHNLELKVQEGLKEIKALNKEIELTQREMIISLSSILDAKDDDTGKHVVRVAEYSKLLAELYGLDYKTIEYIYKAAPLHDAGKVAVPDYILNKPSALNDEEFEIMKTHAIKGYEIFKHSTRPVLKMAAIISKEHHEKWNGSGYPEGLKGEEINIAGRIVALADIFDALTHKRVYKEAWSFEKAKEFIKENSSIMFEPKLVELFLENFDKFAEIHKSFQD